MPEEFRFFLSGRLSILHQTFRELFWRDYRTVLCGGASEPVFLPATDRMPGRIIYTLDYFSSALHEIAHWCIAGSARRRRCDYGYWYAPDGRSIEEQQRFERVEVQPQAIERIFSMASAHAFRVSADNIVGGVTASRAFADNIHQQTLRYCDYGLPDRAARFSHALALAFGQGDPLNKQHYTLDQLQ